MILIVIVIVIEGTGAAYDAAYVRDKAVNREAGIARSRRSSKITLN